MNVSDSHGEIVAQISTHLRAEVREMKGFSLTNLEHMRMFARAWPRAEIGQQPVDQFAVGHNVLLLRLLEDCDQRLAYAQVALTHGWVAVLDQHIVLRTVELSGKTVTRGDLMTQEWPTAVERIGEFGRRDDVASFTWRN